MNLFPLFHRGNGKVMGILIYCVVLQLLISREDCYFSNINKIEFKIEYVLFLE
jgi:hypothetical protein